ncbi:MAG TPA: transglutaminase family protein [Terrimicrobiaceae bacterium]
MIYEVFHWTEYRYSEFISLSEHTLHLLPRDMPGQQVVSSSLELWPEPTGLREYCDYFGNRMNSFIITEPHIGMHIKSGSRIRCDLRPSHPPPTQISWEVVSVRCAACECDPVALEFLYASPYVPYLNELREYAEPSFPSGRPIVEAVMELNSRIHTDFAFDKTATNVSTPLSEVFRFRGGVCQDFAHLEIGCLRSLGLPARYVSGYLRTEPPPGQQRFFGGDASHAWVSVYCLDHEWFDVDPTNDHVAGGGYLTLALGRDYGDVSLIRGTLSGGGEHSLFLSVNVEAIAEDEAG